MLILILVLVLKDALRTIFEVLVLESQALVLVLVLVLEGQVLVNITEEYRHSTRDIIGRIDANDNHFAVLPLLSM